jgi:predicted aminopeptidase
LHYLMQAAHGQVALLNRAQPISEVLKDERTPPRVKNLLKEIEPIKSFGEARGLRPTQNYTEYVKLDRDAAVWVVSACESLRFKGKEWRFPVVGAFPYLGWFDKKDALNFAAELRKEGWDVDLRGARAYSTLGWFRDSVLSTMIPDGKGSKTAFGSLVNVVLHESVHASLYIKDQSYFNESLASFMADKMTLEYLEMRLGPTSDERSAYLESEAYSERAEKRLRQSYRLLDELYASQKSDSEKLIEKEKVLRSLQLDLQFSRSINNATLLQYRTYSTGQEEFEKIYIASRRSWPKFLALLRKLRQDSFTRSQQEDLAPILRSVLVGLD